ncbi:hypothetical protein D1872_113080 [compost metagenome]
MNFNDLNFERNPDIVGWLKIDGTLSTRSYRIHRMRSTILIMISIKRKAKATSPFWTSTAGSTPRTFC